MTWKFKQMIIIIMMMMMMLTMTMTMSTVPNSTASSVLNVIPRTEKQNGNGKHWQSPMLRAVFDSRDTGDDYMSGSKSTTGECGTYHSKRTPPPKVRSVESPTDVSLQNLAHWQSTYPRLSHTPGVMSSDISSGLDEIPLSEDPTRGAITTNLRTSFLTLMKRFVPHILMIVYVTPESNTMYMGSVPVEHQLIPPSVYTVHNVPGNRY